MKTLIPTAVALAGFTAGVMAQGYFQLDGNTINFGVALNYPGNYYSGPFNFEVWELNARTVPAGINGPPPPWGFMPLDPRAAYNDMVAAGFFEQPPPVFTFSDGTINMAEPYKMPDVSPAGATVVVAVAAWNSTAPSWRAMLANYYGRGGPSPRCGVLAWVQPTADFTKQPLPLPPANAWPQQDLVLLPIPEPGAFALAALGAAALLIFRPRK